jgi:DHA1 family tetracycline resistance protein-like MFS transporter
VKLFVRLLPILGITFIDIFGFSILIPIVPLFAKYFGASDLTAGLLFSAYAAFQFLAGPVWGRVSDIIGRKTVLIVSQIGATVGWTMLAFAHTLPMVFLARIIEGASGGNISVTQAYVADKVEPAQRSRAFGFVGAAFASGMVFGPLIGAPLYARYGFPAPFLFAAGLQLLTLILTILMLPESRTIEKGAKVAGFADIGRSLAHGRIAPLLWQQWMYSLALYAMFGVFALFYQAALGFQVTQVYYFFAAFAVASVIMQGFVVGPVSEWLGDRKCSNLGLAIALFGFCIVPFVHTIFSALLMMLPFAAGMALVRPCLTSLITDHTPEDQRGVILGTGSALDNVSGVVMPPIATGLLGSYGTAFVGIPSTIFALVALVMGLIAARRNT